MTMNSRKLLYVIGIFIALFLLPNSNYSQCTSPGFDIDLYTNLLSTQNVTIAPEISSLTYNDMTGEFVAVTDGGSFLKRHTSGAWNAYGITNYGGSHCTTTRFSDTEAITYMFSYTSTLHRYAIADERDRAIVFVDIANSDTNVSHPTTSYLKFSGLNCGGNDGIEGLAYDANTNTMYFATEVNSQKIYSFVVPASITGQTIAVNEVADLRSISGLSTYSTHALDILPNGNIVALVTKPGSGDNGAFARMIVEINPCGAMLGQMDLEPTIASTAELEGIAIKGANLYVIGENAKMYQLQKQVTQGSIIVASPGTLGSYDSGSSTLVNWVSTNVTGNVKIDLYKSGVFVSTLTANTTNDGTHSITLPVVTSNQSGYSVNVVSLDDPSVSGASGDFTIAAPAGTLTVNSPGNGETLNVGTSTPINWSSANLAGNVKIELYQISTLVATLSANTANDGSQSVLVPNVPNGSNYRIKITSINTPSIDDWGGYFSISNPTITVSNPTAGSTYSSASTVNVTWTSSTSGNMKIDLYKGSTLVATLDNSTADDGSRVVTLPTVNTTASDYRIRVSNIASGIYDDSGMFEITAANIFEVTSPSANDVFSGGDFTTVTWNSSYTGSVRINLRKGNSFVSTLKVSTADDGSYSVQLPVVATTGNDYHIKLINREDGSVFDLGDNFTITASDNITVTSPTTGDIFFDGDPINVLWSTNIGGSVAINLFKNGTHVANLKAVTANDQSESLTLPSGLVAGNDYVIRVSSVTNTSVMDDSNPFVIDDVISSPTDADLIVANAGTATQSGNIYAVSGISIRNNGQAQTGQYSVGAYLSTDATISFNDVRIGLIGTYNGTAVGGTETASFAVDLSTLGLADGTYYFGVIADEFDDEIESDDSNNTGMIGSPLATISTNQGGGPCISLASGPHTESFENGLGDWTQSNSDDMNWTRRSGTTPSYLTGPSGAASGSSYVYTESSNGNRNKIAKLVSPCIDLAGTQNPQLTFQCHMYGASMGSLMVNVINPQTNQSMNVFVQTGDQGNQWVQATAQLSQFVGQEIIIEISGLTGISYRSDMAIDQLVISDSAVNCADAGNACDDGNSCTIGETYDSNCNCTGGVYTDNDNDGLCIGEDSNDNDACVPVASQACEDCVNTVAGAFTDGFNTNLNNWIQSSSDQNQWVQNSGNTPSSKTGPAAAIEGSHYVYVEASYGGFPYKNAEMTSPCIDLSSLNAPKLAFAYSMYGSTMGSLSVTVTNTISGQSSVIFSETGNKGNQWLFAQIDLSGFTNDIVQVTIEAVTGYGFRSDIAIDDFEISNTAGNFTTKSETRNFVELASADIEPENEIADLSVYPNPARDFMQIAFESDLTGEATLMMHNTTGQLITTENLSIREGMIQKEIDVTGLASGTYHLSIITNETRLTKKVLVID